LGIFFCSRHAVSLQSAQKRNGILMMESSGNGTKAPNTIHGSEDHPPEPTKNCPAAVVHSAEKYEGSAYHCDFV
jgi:hypothetical protein